MRLGEDNFLFKFRLNRLNKKARKIFELFDTGSEFRPGAYASFTENISVGKNVVIRPGSRLFADTDTFIIIEDDVLMGHGVHLYTNNHAFSNPDIPIRLQGYGKRENVVLEKGCWLGANVIILPGVIVGRNAVVGAGSVVTKSIPANEVWAGNPARRINNAIQQESSSNRSSTGQLYIKKQKHS